MIEQTLCTIFKTNVLMGLENFNTGTPYVYKIALYTADANLNEATVEYIVDGEVIGAGYTAGGDILSPTVPVSSGTTALVSFANVTWNPANFVCRGALIYNSTTGSAVAVLNFGADKTAIESFTVVFPAATNNSAIIRIY